MIDTRTPSDSRRRCADHRTDVGSPVSNGDRFLTFRFGDEEYGLEVLRVREIIELPPVTPLPRMPEHVRGVMNLNGRIIPVLELRRMLDVPSVPFTAETCVIVVACTRGDEEYCVGLIVDTIGEVLAIPHTRIEPAQTAPDGNVSAAALGIARWGDRSAVLLDLDRVLDGGAIPPSSSPESGVVSPDRAEDVSEVAEAA